MAEKAVTEEEGSYFVLLTLKFQGMKRLFTSIDKNNDGEISLYEYVLFAAVLKNPKAEEVLRSMFHFTPFHSSLQLTYASVSFALMDENGDGVLTISFYTLFTLLVVVP